MKKVIEIDGHQLAREVLAREPSCCLDLRSGAIVPLRKCPADQVGETHPGAKRRKRYLPIRNLDDVAIGWKVGATNQRGQLVAGPALTKVAGIAARRWLASLRMPVGIVWEQGGRRQYLDVERHTWTDITA